MGLSARAAVISCIGFIAGMAWLVSEAGRPIAELPTPLVTAGPPALGESVAPPATAADRLARPNPIALAWESQRRREQEQMRLVSAAMPADVDLGVPPLPPLYVPRAPLLVEGESPGEGSAPALADSTEAGAGEMPAAVEAAEAGQAMVLAAGTDAARLTAGEEAGQAAGVIGHKEYRVRPGDTLTKVMRREWQRDDRELLDALLAANPHLAQRRNRIFVGEILRIPVLPSAAADLASAAALAGGRGAEKAASRQQPVRWYTVQRRDSLVSIARRVLNDGDRWREIAELNKLRDVNRIVPGERIKLPGAATDT